MLPSWSAMLVLSVVAVINGRTQESKPKPPKYPVKEPPKEALVDPPRPQIRPSLECACLSSQTATDANFGLACQQNKDSKNEDNDIFSCEKNDGTFNKLDVTYVPNLGLYKLHTDLKGWDEARKACMEAQGDLAVINSAEEAEALKNIFSQYPNIHKTHWINNQSWVGYTDKEKEGEFVTVSGVALRDAGWAEWLPEQPDDRRGAEDCVALFRTAQLNDLPCDLRLPFFCEISL